MLLDTNVVSEIMKADTHPGVRRFLDGLDLAAIYLSTPTLGELRYGIELLVPSRRRRGFEIALDQVERIDFAGRILPFDAEAAVAYGEIKAARRRSGRPVQAIDAQIAAIARVHGLTLATRNVRDFAETGIDLVDPFAL